MDHADWWQRASEKQRLAYLKRHPRSKYADQWRKEKKLRQERGLPPGSGGSNGHDADSDKPDFYPIVVRGLSRGIATLNEQRDDLVDHLNTALSQQDQRRVSDLVSDLDAGRLATNPPDDDDLDILIENGPKAEDFGMEDRPREFGLLRSIGKFLGKNAGQALLLGTALATLPFSAPIAGFFALAFIQHVADNGFPSMEDDDDFQSNSSQYQITERLVDEFNNMLRHQEIKPLARALANLAASYAPDPDDDAKELKSESAALAKMSFRRVDQRKYNINYGRTCIGTIECPDYNATFGDRVWRTTLHDGFHEVSFRSGKNSVDPTEPYTVLNKHGVWLHNPVRMSQGECRAWVRHVFDKDLV